MERVTRQDRITVDLSPAGGAIYHANGWVDAPGTLPIVGAFPYPEHGTVELVPEDEALDPASLETLIGIPVTIDHPGDMLHLDNTREHAHGAVLRYTPRHDRTGVDVVVRLYSRDALEAKRNGGRAQLSLGYDAVLDRTPGTTDAGQSYTAIQRNRRYNHLAMVGLARVGDGATLRFDAMQTHKLTIGKRTYTIAALLASGLKGAVVPDAQRADASIETAEIVIDGVTMVLPRAVVDSIIAMLSGGAPAAAPTDAATAPEDEPMAQQPPPRMDAAAIQALVAKEVAKALETHGARMDAESRQRLEVERVASEILGPSFGYADQDTWGIAAAAILAEDAAAKPRVDAMLELARKGDQRAQGRLLGRLDAALEQYQAGYTSGGALALAIDTGRRDRAAAEDEDEDSSDAARRRMIDRQSGRADSRKPKPRPDDEADAAE